MNRSDSRNTNSSTKIIVASGVEVLVDDIDYQIFKKWRWHIDTKGYVYRHNIINGIDKPRRMHREITLAGCGMDVDHINGCKTDNRRSNLRICTRMQNLWNSRTKSSNTSGFKGIDFRQDKGKFRARIRAGGKRIHIGYFDTAELASEAYKKEAKKLHGDFCVL